MDSNGPNAVLAEQWDGTAWSIQTTPNPRGELTSALAAVSCTTSTACTAAGEFARPVTGDVGLGGPELTLILTMAGA